MSYPSILDLYEPPASKDPGVSLASDRQVGGDHYKLLAIQPMEYALANHLNYAQANVIKYVTRYNLKAGGEKWKEDLKKAIHNIELLIEHEEKERSGK